MPASRRPRTVSRAPGSSRSPRYTVPSRSNRYAEYSRVGGPGMCTGSAIHGPSSRVARHRRLTAVGGCELGGAAPDARPVEDDRGAGSGPRVRASVRRRDRLLRSEERRVGKECRSRGWAEYEKKKKRSSEGGEKCDTGRCKQTSEGE